jgi:hypothetical protein
MWKIDILQQLKKRDATEWHPFKDMLKDYQQLSDMYIGQEEHIRQLEDEVAERTQHHRDLEMSYQSSTSNE